MVNKKKLIWFARLIFSAGLLFLLYRRVDIGEVAGVFKTVRVLPLIGFFTLLLVNTGIHALKWEMLLKADGIRIPYLSLLASYLVGSFFNVFLPSNIGGDAYRIYDVARYSKRTAHAFASVLADRISGYMALALMAAIAGLAGMQFLPHPIIIIVPVAGVIALCMLVAFSFKPSLILKLMGLKFIVKIYDFRPFILKLLESVKQYRAAPMLFLKIMLASFLFQIIAATSIFLLARGLTIDAPYIAFIVIVPFISIIEAVPITIFGLGIRDASYAYFLVNLGVPEAQALTLALAYVVLTLVYVSSGGVIFLLRPRTAA